MTMLFLDKTLPRAKKVYAFDRISRIHLKATHRRVELIYQSVMTKEEARQVSSQIYWEMLTEPH